MSWLLQGEETPYNVYHSRNSLSKLFLLIDMVWLVLVMVTRAHTELRVADTDFIGLFAPGAFSIRLLVQFATKLAHRTTQIIIGMAEL
jgi:hypothetical protein